MLENMIPLVVSVLPLWQKYLVSFLALSFVAFVGRFIHFLFRG